jgi:formate--tetrahydrofolate ligase
LYPDDMSLELKIDVIARAMYGADGVNLLPGVMAKLARFEALGYRHLPICVAKTQSSLSDDPKRIGRPHGFQVVVRDTKLAAGAGFVVAYAGDIMTMPGLPKEPSAETIDIDADGNTVGLF